MSRVTQNANAALIGNQVTAVPRYTSTLQARWTLSSAWSVNGAVRHVGRMAVNAQNTEWSRSYHIVDLGMQYRLPASNSLGLRDALLHLTVNNLADKDYASSTSIIGGERLVAPGAPRTVLLGLSFSL